MSFRTNYNVVPIGEIQRATYRGQLMKYSAIYDLLCNQFPITITIAVDGLCQQRADAVSNDEKLNITKLVGMLSELRTDVMTNKSLKPFTVSYNNAPIVFESNIKKNEDQVITWYEGNRSLLESYLHWRIHDYALKCCRTIIDPFIKRKQHAQGKGLNIAHMKDLTATVMADVELTEAKLKPMFLKLMQACLWSARASTDENPSSPFDMTGTCLADDSSRLWNFLWKRERTDLPIGIVLNDTGYELFADLCLATFLIKTKIASTINFYGKVIPWYSSAMKMDIAIAIGDAKKHAGSSSTLNEMFDMWNLYLSTGQFNNVDAVFWSLPNSISEMPEKFSQLYEECRKSQVLILKGNFAYSKLVNDTVMPETLLFSQIVRKCAPDLTIASIRILKTDLICGLDQRLLSAARDVNRYWNLTTGYGAIQFYDLMRYIQ